MNKIKYILVISIIFSSIALAKEKLSYVDGSKPFVKISNVNRQAEAWGTCSAAYDVMATILQSKPAQAKKFKDLGNGASLAVVMTHVSDGLTKDITPEKFNALWNFSKTLYDSIPETRKNMILADAEALGKKGSDVFLNKISETVIICMKNSKDQQNYIDTWRELAKSGLLKVPSN